MGINGAVCGLPLGSGDAYRAARVADVPTSMTRSAPTRNLVPPVLLGAGSCHRGLGKSEKINAADLSRRLVIEFTAQLPATRREAVTP